MGRAAECSVLRIGCCSVVAKLLLTLLLICWISWEVMGCQMIRQELQLEAQIASLQRQVDSSKVTRHLAVTHPHAVRMSTFDQSWAC